jgi:hypothetical protein
VRGLIGIVIALAATAVSGVLVLNIIGQSGVAQPWDSELNDDFIFVRALPLVLGLGVAYGLIGGWVWTRSAARRADGAVRRFSGATVLLHLLITVGFVLALPTGLWQYLGGILDVQGPLPVFMYYRIHYIGAAIILASVAAFITYWWMTGERSLVIPRSEWPRYLRGFALELPPMLRTRLASLLRIDLRQPAGSPGQFTFYEKTFMFPGWSTAIALITVTGLVKLLRYAVPVPGTVVFVVSTLHVTAMVMLILLTLDHLRYYLARWPLVVAIFTGWLPPRRAAARTAPEGASAAGGGDD